MVLVWRPGEYYPDVVYDACAIMWALHGTSAKTASPHCYGAAGWNPLIAGRFGVARWLEVVDVSCGWALFCMHPMWINFQHFLHLLQVICSKDAKHAKLWPIWLLPVYSGPV